MLYTGSGAYSQLRQLMQSDGHFGSIMVDGCKPDPSRIQYWVNFVFHLWCHTVRPSSSCLNIIYYIILWCQSYDYWYQIWFHQYYLTWLSASFGTCHFYLDYLWDPVLVSAFLGSCGLVFFLLTGFSLASLFFLSLRTQTHHMVGYSPMLLHLPMLGSPFEYIIGLVLPISCQKSWNLFIANNFVLKEYLELQSVVVIVAYWLQ